MVSRAERFGRRASGPRRVMTEVVVTSLLVAVLAGGLWWLLAPEVVGVVVAGELLADSVEAQKIFGRDVAYALVTAACGVVLAAVFMVRNRHHPVATVVALGFAGIGGALLTTLVGVLLGWATTSDVSDAAEGAELVAPLALGASQAVVVWPLVATVTAAVIALVREDDAAPGPASVQVRRPPDVQR